MKIEYNKVYDFDLTNKVAFGDLPPEVLNTLFTDGRVASKFLENQLPHWFPELQYVDAIGHDHVSSQDQRKFDLKGFTRRGACYAPSNMLGKGRSIVHEQVYEHAKDIDYIFSDIIDFPRVRIIFKRGTDVVREFPSTKIERRDRDRLFH